MNGNDIMPDRFRPRPGDLLTALALLTRLPLPSQPFDSADARPAAHAAWAYPLAGLAVGGVAALMGWLALLAGLPPAAAALLMLGTGTVLTGAMHEDGLADCADGFWGGWTVARRLEIMKDSQIGTYGVAALILSYGLRAAALIPLVSAGSSFAALIGAAVVSRAGMVAVMHGLPSAREGGLSRQTGRVPRPAAIIACALCLAAIPFLPASGLAVIGAAVLAPLAVAGIARAKIGGQTGDVLGATQQCSETALLLVCAAALA